MDTQLRHSLGPFHAGFLLWLRFLALCVTLVRELVSDRVRSSSISLGFIFGLCCGPGLCVSQSRPSRAETAALEAGSRDLSSASWTPGAGGVVRRAESRWWRLRSGSEGPRTRGDDSLSPSPRAGEGRRPSIAGRQRGREDAPVLCFCSVQAPGDLGDAGHTGEHAPPPLLYLPVQVCLSSRNASDTPRPVHGRVRGPPWPRQADTRSSAPQDGGGVSAALESAAGLCLPRSAASVLRSVWQ